MKNTDYKNHLNREGVFCGILSTMAAKQDAGVRMPGRRHGGFKEDNMFKEINPKEFTNNAPAEFGDKWMLLTAGNEEAGFNTMTIAWGQFGSVWGRKGLKGCIPTAVCYVRPSRYTKVFMDSQEYFTLCSFPEEYRKTLGYLGSHSGRDEDKITVCGLTPVYSDTTTYFAEAETVYICKKLYQAPIVEEGFVDKSLIDENYPLRDYHEMYIGEIVKVLKKM